MPPSSTTPDIAPSPVSPAHLAHSPPPISPSPSTGERPYVDLASWRTESTIPDAVYFAGHAPPGDEDCYIASIVGDMDGPNTIIATSDPAPPRTTQQKLENVARELWNHRMSARADVMQVETHLGRLKEMVGRNGERLESNGERLERVERGLEEVKKDVGVLKNDVATLKVDMGVVKTDVGALKVEMGVLGADVSSLKVDVEGVKRDIVDMKGDISTLKTDVSTLKNDFAGMYHLMQEFITEIRAR